MLSFNALGAACRWLFGVMRGLRPRLAARSLLVVLVSLLATGLMSCRPANSAVRPPGAIGIDLADVFATLGTLPEDEVPEQLRDFAVYGTLVQLGHSADDIAKALHRTAPVRLPYLEDMVRFEYGRGRRALVGPATLLFVDDDDPDPMATIGRLADRVRMETGEIPEKASLFEVKSNLDDGELVVTKKADLPGTDLFGEAYGYHEAKVRDRAGLEAFLATIDDVSHAEDRSGTLVLGGRRFPRSRTRGVTLEDVAVLYQAHDALPEGKEPGFSLDPQWNIKALLASLEKLARDPCAVLDEALALAKRTEGLPDDAQTKAAVLARDLRAGFANVPRARMSQLCSTVRAKQSTRMADMMRRVRAAADLPVVQRDHRITAELAALAETARKKGATLDVAFVGWLADYINASSGLQCARYDGPLQGTRVGMNLFYTDLLAKLWKSVDYHHAAPVTAVSGFKTTPRVRLDQIYLDEDASLPNNRIWFGPFAEAFSKSNAEGQIAFQHISTRIFAAGSNPLNPAAESQPNEHGRKTIGWWDRHYAQVADYEQEYYVQNQIIKWSVLTAWMHQRDEGSYLRSVRPDKSLRFDRWHTQAVASGSLRYTYPLSLRPESEWPAGTECIDLLASYRFDQYGDGRLAYMSGGVSAGGKKFVKEIPTLSATADRATRRAFVAPAVKKPGSAERPQPTYEAGNVFSKATPQTVWHADGASFKPGRLDVEHTRTAAGTGKVTLRGESGPIGELSARTAGQEVSLHFEGGALEQGRSASRAAPVGKSADREAFRAQKSWRSPVFVAGDQSWILPASNEGAVHVTRGAGKPGEAAIRFKTATAEIHAGHLSSSDVAARLDRHAWQELAPIQGEAARALPQGVRRTFQTEGPPADAVEITLAGVGGTHDLRAHVTSDGRVFLPRPSEPGARAAWRDADAATGFTPASLAKLTAEARTAGARVAVDRVADPGLPARLRSLERADGRAAVAELTKGLDQAGRDRLRDTATAQASSLVAQGRGAEALRRYELAAEIAGGPTPDMHLGMALAQLETGKVRTGWAGVESHLADPSKLAAADKTALQAFISSPGGDHLDDVRAVLNGRLGGLVPGAPQAPRSATLVADHGFIAARVEFRTVPAQPMDPQKATAMARGLRSDAAAPHGRVDVYVDPSLSLNATDFAAAPGETFEQILRMKHVDIREIESLPGSDYRPSVVVDLAAKRSYRKIEVPESDPRTRTRISPPPPRPPPRPLPPSLILLRNCDKDSDGKRDKDCCEGEDAQRSDCQSP